MVVNSLPSLMPAGTMRELIRRHMVEGMLIHSDTHTRTDTRTCISIDVNRKSDKSALVAFTRDSSTGAWRRSDPWPHDPDLNVPYYVYLEFEAMHIGDLLPTINRFAMLSNFGSVTATKPANHSVIVIFFNLFFSVSVVQWMQKDILKSWERLSGALEEGNWRVCRVFSWSLWWKLLSGLRDHGVDLRWSCSRSHCQKVSRHPNGFKVRWAAAWLYGLSFVMFHPVVFKMRAWSSWLRVFNLRWKSRPTPEPSRAHLVVSICQMPLFGYHRLSKLDVVQLLLILGTFPHCRTNKVTCVQNQ